MTDEIQKKRRNRLDGSGDPRQNSYVENATHADTQDTPDIQTPGAAGNFGNVSTNAPAGKAKTTALPSKDRAGRTPGDQPQLAQQPNATTATRPGDAAEPSNEYSGT